MSEATLFLHVGDEKFDLWDAVQGATLGDLEDLQEWTARKGFDGVTVQSIDGLMRHIDSLVEADDFNPLQIISSKQFLQNMPGMIWLCHRGDEVDFSLDDARRVSASSVSISVESELPKDPSSVGDDVAA
jgi:hypothetical protein